MVRKFDWSSDSRLSFSFSSIMGAAIHRRRPQARIAVTHAMSTQKNTTVDARFSRASATMASSGMVMLTAPATSPSAMPSIT